MRFTWGITIFVAGIFLYAVNTYTNSLNQFEITETSQGVFLLNKSQGLVYKYGQITTKSGDLWDEGWFENSVMDVYETADSFQRLEEHEASAKKK